MTWSIFSNGLKCQVNLDVAQFENNGPEVAKGKFKEIFDFIKNSDDSAIIRGRLGSGNIKYLYTRQGSPVRQFFQRILDWTNGAKIRRTEARKTINNVIEKLNLTSDRAKLIIKKIDEITNIEKDFDTKELKKNLQALELIIEEEEEEEEEYKNNSLLNSFKSNNKNIENLSKKYISPEKEKINNEKIVLDNLHKDNGIIVEEAIDLLTSNKAPMGPRVHEEEVAETINEPATAQPERRFGGLFVISPNEQVTARRGLNKIYADAYIFPETTTYQKINGEVKIDGKTESNNKKIQKFEQKISSGNRYFIRMRLETPIKADEDFVGTLAEEGQANYLEKLKETYRKNFELLVQSFAQDKKPLESIALVPISQKGVLVPIEAEALATVVQEFKSQHPDVVIQVVTDGVPKKTMIENALKALAI